MEALRTQLDALQIELYQVQAENRRLREANPQQAQLLDVEEELAQTREENVRLAQQINELGGGSEGAGETRGEQERRLKETIAQLESEAAERERQLDSYMKQLEQSSAALEEMSTRAVKAEQGASCAQEELRNAQDRAELHRLRAVADETRKWEEREARLVQCI